MTKEIADIEFFSVKGLLSAYGDFKGTLMQI